jgi:hypothetical protein
MRVELAGSWQEMNGYGDNPGAIPDELGKEILQMSIEAVAEAIENFYAATLNADKK